MRERNKVTIDFTHAKRLTKQSFKNDADINTIMKKYVKTGMLSPEGLANRQAVFADVSEIGDFQQCQNRVLAAKAAFMTLSPEIRTRFNNNPGELLDFCADADNLEEAIDLGIIPKPEEPPKEEKPPKVEATPTQTPPAKPTEPAEAPKA